MSLYIKLPDAARRYTGKMKDLQTVEIVRCGECRYSSIINNQMICTIHTAQLTAEDYFCNFGEAKKRH